MWWETNLRVVNSERQQRKVMRRKLKCLSFTPTVHQEENTWKFSRTRWTWRIWETNAAQTPGTWGAWEEEKRCQTQDRNMREEPAAEPPPQEPEAGEHRVHLTRVQQLQHTKTFCFWSFTLKQKTDKQHHPESYFIYNKLVYFICIMLCNNHH